MAISGKSSAEESLHNLGQLSRRSETPWRLNIIWESLSCMREILNRPNKSSSALAMKSDVPEVQAALGTALMMLGRPQAALEHLQSAVRLQPDDADAHNNLAAALVSLGRTSEAVEHLREAVRLKPTYIQAWNNLAAAYDELHRSEEAVAAAEKVLTLARSQGNSALAQQMEDWLAAHRAPSSK